MRVRQVTLRQQQKALGRVMQLLGALIAVTLTIMLIVENRQRIAEIRRRLMKRVVNPGVMKFAGRYSWSPHIVFEHVGRRSQRMYRTPVVGQIKDGKLVVPLAFGVKADWYRNILAAGHCTLLWKGQKYHAEEPVLISEEAALPLFPPPQRTVMKLFHIPQYVQMQVTVVESVPTEVPAAEAVPVSAG